MVINQKVKYDESSERLNVIFAALADPTRRSIIGYLSKHNATVNELAAPYDMSLPAISKHLKILEKAGLISTMKDAQFRPRRLEVESLRDALSWLENYQRLWE